MALLPRASVLSGSPSLRLTLLRPLGGPAHRNGGEDDYELQRIDNNDQLIVADLGGNAAWHGFNEECSNWITTNLQA